MQMMTDGASASLQRRNPLLAICPQLLAVELLLLAFFIVLNGTSTFESARSRAVIDSLHQALGTKTFGGGGVTHGEAADLARVESRIAQLAQAIGTVRPQGPSKPNALWIDLPVDVFFRPGDDRINPAQAPFMERLSELLARTPDSFRYEVAVLRGTADDSATGGDLRLRQAAAVATALQGQLEAGTALAAGVMPDPGVGLRLDVSWSAPEEPSGAQGQSSEPEGVR
jgi:hypothetical protein